MDKAAKVDLIHGDLEFIEVIDEKGKTVVTISNGDTPIETEDGYSVKLKFNEGE